MQFIRKILVHLCVLINVFVCVCVCVHTCRPCPGDVAHQLYVHHHLVPSWRHKRKSQGGERGEGGEMKRRRSRQTRGGRGETSGEVETKPFKRAEIIKTYCVCVCVCMCVYMSCLLPAAVYIVDLVVFVEGHSLHAVCQRSVQHPDTYTPSRERETHSRQMRSKQGPVPGTGGILRTEGPCDNEHEPLVAPLPAEAESL